MSLWEHFVCKYLILDTISEIKFRTEKLKYLIGQSLYVFDEIVSENPLSKISCNWKFVSTSTIEEWVFFFFN